MARNYCPNMYDAFCWHEAEKERELAKRQVCSECDAPITSDWCYYINGEYILKIRKEGKMANEKKHEMPMVTIPVWEYADLIRRDSLLNTIEVYMGSEGYHSIESIEMILGNRKVGEQDGNTL